MKRLWAFCGLAGLLLGSAAPPPPRPAQKPAILVAAPEAGRPREVPAASPAARPAFQPDKTQLPPRAEPAVATRPAADLREEKAGNVKILVSLPQQKAYVFKDGRLFATSKVSTGKRGHETPAGTFRILQKKVHHRSNRYANAPMPYMQRLTWSGVALHAGRVPGYRASHGCIRLPWSFARKLYGITDYATEVTVTHARPKSAEAAREIG